VSNPKVIPAVINHTTTHDKTMHTVGQVVKKPAKRIQTGNNVIHKTINHGFNNQIQEFLSIIFN
jgi:pyridoxine 5'-phosphate synthase PdxJ